MHSISHVIFDWDGTVMDSAHKIVLCMQAAALKSGLKVPSEEQIRHIIGISLEPAIAKLFNVDSNSAHEIAQHYKQAFVERDAIQCSLFDGVIQTLEQLNIEYTLGVATGKTRRGLDRALKEGDLAQYFDKTRCANDPNVQSKPHPSMLEQLLYEWDIAAENAVMIGDTSYDMAMAKSINMPRIAVSYGVHQSSLLQQYQPLAIVDTFAQIPSVIKQANLPL